MRTGSKYSQQELIEGILNSSEKIVQYIYHEYYYGIRQMILNNSGSDDDARDVFQEAMIVLYQKLKDTSFILTSSLNTYLYSVARIIWYRELKRRRDLHCVDEFDTLVEYQDMLEAIEKKERLQFFREKFEELSDDCKRILHLFLNNIPIRDITKMMGYSSDQHTKNRRLRCKMSLIKKIQSSEYYKELSYGKSKID